MFLLNHLPRKERVQDFDNLSPVGWITTIYQNLSSGFI